ncbi:hypothetical protein KLP28_09710 [Nocardioidaceae bacterium]|nr:hypothetical protein KLP28_09710 [Nocardioidaceae bacterium]
MTFSIHLGRIGAWLAVGGGSAWVGLALLNLIFQDNSVLLIPLKVLGALGLALALAIFGKDLKTDLDYWPSWGLGAGLAILFSFLWAFYAIQTTNVTQGGGSTNSTPSQIFIAYAIPGALGLVFGVLGLSQRRGVQGLTPNL